MTEFSCPVPASAACITMAHGGGGRRSQELFDQVFGPVFDNPVLNRQLDAGYFAMGEYAFAMTTDSFVVRPLFFPGGDIGSLAVHGTVNDLAVSGARPRALSASFILEEGLPIAVLNEVVTSMQRAARAAVPGLSVVCGDTKVVERIGNAADPGLIISMSAVGEPLRGTLSPGLVREGDAIIVSGPVGDHGMAIMSVREGLSFESPIVSDSAPLWNLALRMMQAGEIHCMRDPTRGGLSSALNEIAAGAEMHFVIEEAQVPVRPTVAAACEILGLDPFYVACEGRLVAFVAASDADAVLAAMKAEPDGEEAVIIGHVESRKRPGVAVVTPHGTTRPLDMLSGEQLPRIC